MAKKKTAKKAATSAKMSSKKTVKKNTNRKQASSKRQADAADLITMILEDHKPLKQLIKVMKNSDYDVNERRAAFEEFCPLLISHAKPEEQTMYAFMKQNDDLREGGFEGDVEHQLADQMVEEAKRTDDEDLWSARVKVLAELIEHHIKEEEEDMLPDFRKHTEKEERATLGDVYLRLKTGLEMTGGEDSPSEKTMRPSETAGKSGERRTSVQ
jgi:hemerythrin superfamily protein